MLVVLATCIGVVGRCPQPSLIRHDASSVRVVRSAVANGPAASPARAAQASAASAPAPLPTLRLPEIYPRPAATVLEAQIALARHGLSSGPIDGVAGGQTTKALEAFQDSQGLAVTGRLARDTRGKLLLFSPPLKQITVEAADLARLQPLSPTWLGKSEQTALDYATLLELVAERFRAHPALIRQRNPAVDWDHPAPGLVLTVPAAEPEERLGRAASVHIFLEDHLLQVRDADGTLVAHFPVSIARNVEKRPVGELHVTVVIRNPDYTFDPDVFPESPEARELGRKLVLPPGPNNPVGLAWIGLDRPGYGIHGTPSPEQVGRTESHGCFRLANWDALTLCELAWVGLPVFVDP